MKRSTTHKYLLLVVTCTLLVLSAKAQNYTKEAEQLLNTAISNGEMIGVSAGFIKNGNIIWASAKGYANQESELPFKTSSSTRIASISKIMTAVAIMQLVETGQLSLEDSFHQIIPDYPINDKGSFTIRELLQHSAGIGAYKNGKERENMKNYASLSEAIEVFKNRPLLFEPGTSFHYSSYGYTLLGLIIEKISGQTFGQYLESKIWNKTGMNHTHIFQENLTIPTQLYHKNERGKIKEAQFTNLSDRLPGGGVYSSLIDMLKFGNALLNNTLISKESFDLISEDSGLKKEGNGYGMGLYMYGDNPNFGPVFGHNGTQTGASTFLMLLPEVETAIVVLSNTSGAIQQVTQITVELFDVAGKAD